MGAGRSKFHNRFVMFIAFIFVLILFLIPLAAWDCAQHDGGVQPYSITDSFLRGTQTPYYGGVRSVQETLLLKASWYSAVILTMALILFNRYCETFAKHSRESISSKLAGLMSCEISLSLGSNGPPSSIHIA